MTYIDLFSINGITKCFQYSGKYSPYLLSNFKKTICYKLACSNSTMKYNWCNLDLCSEESAKKYFIVIIDYVGYHVSPIIHLFCKYTITTMINLNLSRLPSDCIFALYTFMHGVTGYPFPGSYIYKGMIVDQVFNIFQY